MLRVRPTNVTMLLSSTINFTNTHLFFTLAMDLHYKVIASINSPKIQVNLSVKMPGHLGCNGPIGFHTALMEKKRKLNFSKQVKRVQVQN